MEGSAGTFKDSFDLHPKLAFLARPADACGGKWAARCERATQAPTPQPTRSLSGWGWYRSARPWPAWTDILLLNREQRLSPSGCATAPCTRSLRALRLERCDLGRRSSSPSSRGSASCPSCGPRPRRAVPTEPHVPIRPPAAPSRPRRAQRGRERRLRTPPATTRQRAGARGHSFRYSHLPTVLVDAW